MISIFSLLLLFFFIIPLASVAFCSIVRLEPDRGDRSGVQYGLTLDYYAELFINRRNSVFYVPPLTALLNSLAYASITVLLALSLGFPAAAALVHPRRLERWFNSILMLPLGASAVTLGLGLIVSYGRLMQSPLVVPLAHTLVALPFVIRSLQPSLESIPIQLRQAAATLGASPTQVWREVDWPIIRPAFLSAAVFAFTISLGEFGATSLISRPEYPTLPVAIYHFLSQPGAMNYGQAMAMATMLMLIAGAGILSIERLRIPDQRDF